MKTWIAILVSVGLFIACFIITPILCWILVPVTSIWAGYDSTKIQFGKYKAGGHPVLVTFACLMLWLISFPWYLSMRYKVKEGMAVLKDGSNVAEVKAKTASQGRQVTPLKIVSIILLVAGFLWAIIAFNADTTVTMEEKNVIGQVVSSQTVHNIGLMDARRNHLIIAGLTLIIGVVLLVLDSMNSMKKGQQSSAMTKCPYCAEDIRSEATICRFCGNKLGPKQTTDGASQQKIDVDATASIVACPHCSEAINIAGLGSGKYSCPKCDGHFQID